METWQKTLIIFWGIISFILFIKGFFECKDKKNAYGLTPKLSVFGIFSWGDAVVFGLFWVLVSLITLVLNDWILFLLIISVFWVVRSFGETIYWFNQQFSAKTYAWNRPERLALHWLFRNDSIWFIYQIAWQCVSVVSIIVSIFLAKTWLR